MKMFLKDLAKGGAAAVMLITMLCIMSIDILAGVLFVIEVLLIMYEFF